MTYFRHAMIAAALVAGASTASAQTTVITREPVESRTVVTTEPLQLTPVQRRTVYRTITDGTPLVFRAEARGSQQRVLSNPIFVRAGS